MSRQAQQIAARRDFWLYIDEFANFITPSMAEILSGARKYRIGLTLAHHELHQLQRNPEVASAVMSHPFTRIVFRVGDDDAKKLAEGFSYFEAKDLRNLEAGQAVCRVERSDFDFRTPPNCGGKAPCSRSGAPTITRHDSPTDSEGHFFRSEAGRSTGKKIASNTSRPRPRRSATPGDSEAH